MRRPGRLPRVLLCVVLEFGALAGAPMRPERIEKLMRMLSRPRLAQVLPEDDEHGGGYPLREAKRPRQSARRRARGFNLTKHAGCPARGRALR